MISGLMELALSQRVVVIGMALVLIVVGLYSFHELDIEAYPDPVQPLIEVLTLPNGLSAEEVEKLVTVPLEVGLARKRAAHILAVTRGIGPHRRHRAAGTGLIAMGSRDV